MAATERGEIITGPRARLSIDGKKVGWATNVSWTERIEYEEVEVLDNIRVQEHAPVRYRVSVSLGEIVISSKTLKSQGFFPRTGQSSEAHLREILILGALVATVEDTSGSGPPLATFEDFRVAEQTVSITAGGVAGRDVTAVAISVRDQSEV